MGGSRFDKIPPRDRYIAIVAELDELVSARPASKPLYSKELAEEIGTSVRTLHSASLSVVGMSLHSYLRLKRLLQVRRQLSAGATSVKAAALANGFWHLGDFSRVYRRAFDELPSQTLARSKQDEELDLRTPVDTKAS
ncbi:helix-turn-helix transcriptional regulator [Bradyrhizobium sp. B117]|uniref:helix-turn-helix transcriptional regulator n=1 Tax=Bradyrhizobium sp. B117 TaxID=3140246 RepID=UPI00318393F7